MSAGRDVVIGMQWQVSRTSRGNLRDAKKARAELLAEVSKGRGEQGPTHGNACDRR